MRVRVRPRSRLLVPVALGLAVIATLVGLLIDMSGSGPRLAGDDHVIWPAANASVAVAAGGQVMCMHSTVLPDDAAEAVLAIHDSVNQALPLPRIVLDFVDDAGRTVAHGVLAAGAAESAAVVIPIHSPHGPSVQGSFCLHIGGRRTLVFDGLDGAGVTTVDGVTQAGSPAILYYRAGSESWWQLLGALDFRLGLGKSPMFGDWTLPVLVLLGLGIWFGAIRLLIRELR